MKFLIVKSAKELIDKPPVSQISTSSTSIVAVLLTLNIAHYGLGYALSLLVGITTKNIFD